ncbi:unnamed protein product [Rhizophagus irregularis]|uniref:Uncharacterized protein n=1 Tax=Rhizophagus irregularis TaxID=588596 RepID=A0A916E8U7_9GLOM|nr:unnamed protein product [Rhizophagus irregularis]CAB5180522.1 unnamed protein product [Rhizophagus irregularis]CAB5363485.1 unnamed protein product [Rhizophagus irregularis]
MEYTTIASEFNYSKGCQKYLPIAEFSNEITGKVFATCNYCRFKNKASRQKNKLLKQQFIEKNDLESIEGTIISDNLTDYTCHFLNLYKNNDNIENKENTPKFCFSCLIDISLLDGDSKQIANTLVGIIADVDEYSWVYVSLFL